MVLETLKYVQLYSHDKNIIHNDLIYSQIMFCCVFQNRRQRWEKKGAAHDLNLGERMFSTCAVTFAKLLCQTKHIVCCDDIVFHSRRYIQISML